MTENKEADTTFDDEIDKSEFDDLPSTNIDAKYRIGFAMSGSFPLHIADIFFCDTGIYLLEYGNITPLLGLTTQKHRREAEAMRAVYKYHGIDEVILQADFVMWFHYEFIDQVVIHNGGRLGRPKITFKLDDDSSQSYRIHDSPAPKDIKEDIAALGLSIELKSGHGFSASDLTGR